LPSHTALRRRITPSVPLRLTLTNDDGQEFSVEFRLSFDFNAMAEIEERAGVSMLDGEIWKHLSARTLRIMFWASALHHHPEFRSDEGLEVVGSYMDPSNAGTIAEALERAFVASVPATAQGAPTDGPTTATDGVSSGPSLGE